LVWAARSVTAGVKENETHLGHSVLFPQLSTLATMSPGLWTSLTLDLPAKLTFLSCHYLVISSRILYFMSRSSQAVITLLTRGQANVTSQGC